MAIEAEALRNVEDWRPVEPTELYEVSSFGRIRNVKTKTIVTLRYDRKGYLQVWLQIRPGQAKALHVSRVVLRAFRGPPPDGRLQAAHLNGIRDDDRLSNLAWVSPTENAAHKKIHGTEAIGERHGSAKLTDKDVAEIRRRYAQGCASKLLASEYGVNRTSITRAISKKLWSHVDAE